VTTGFDRPNLSFAVVPCKGRADKERRLVAALQDEGALPAIVYAGTRARTMELAERLAGALDREVLAYHAGIARDARAEAQRRFMGGEVDVVVATNAFGMGVDKADVRTVAHEAVPGSVEAYYQEAGRAGRDGLPSRALLFAEGRDKGLHVHFIQRGELADDQVARVARTLVRGAEAGRYDVGFDALAAAGADEEQLRAILGILARVGVVQPAPSSPDRARGRVLGDFDGRAKAAARTLAGEAQRVRWRQYRAVWGFVEGSQCRRVALLRHFGDTSTPEPEVPCCDVCDPSLVPAAAAPRGNARAAGGGAATLDEAIFDVVGSAEPTVGRTRAVEILRGGRSKVVLKYSYDGLPGYGSFAHLGNDEVLARVDELLAAGRLRSTGGHYPKLEVA
jgi:ATP-dependent DNA helicase RecQ